MRAGILGGVPALCMALALTAAAATGAGALASAQDLQPIPALSAHITDLTGTLTAAQQADLEQKLADFQNRKGAQLAVLLVPTTAPEALEQYSIRVVEAWQLGRKNVDDGALLLIAKNDHAVRIENGYGLEGVLTDVASNRIIENTMVPLLLQGQYYHAISAGLDQMIGLIDGESLPPADQSWQKGRGIHPTLLLPLLFVAMIAASVLGAHFGRVLTATVVGAGAGFTALLITKALLSALGWGVGAFLWILLRGTSSGGWSTGGRGLGSAGFGGGGFSGGGFSGGGGSFGGGGASGHW